MQRVERHLELEAAIQPSYTYETELKIELEALQAHYQLYQDSKASTTHKQQERENSLLDKLNALKYAVCCCTEDLRQAKETIAREQLRQTTSLRPKLASLHQQKQALERHQAAVRTEHQKACSELKDRLSREQAETLKLLDATL